MFNGLRRHRGYSLVNAALLCLMLVVALHHLAPRGGYDTDAHGRCDLCVLIATALLAPLMTVALIVQTRRNFLCALPVLPPLRPETWASRSHRGPPALFS